MNEHADAMPVYI